MSFIPRETIEERLEKLYATLNAVQELRTYVRQCFEHLSNGNPYEQSEESRTRFLRAFQKDFNLINTQVTEVESLINGLQIPTAPLNLGNPTYLAQETIPERQALYPQLVNSYKWMDRLHDHSLLAFNYLHANNLRRTYMNGHQKRPRLPTYAYNNPDPDNPLNNHTDKLLSVVGENLLTSYKVLRPFGSNAVVIVNINRVMKAAIVCKGVLIEWVTVKGFNEPLENEEIFTESRFEVFRKVQEHTQLAMLHFFSPMLPDLAIKSYMTWLNSYSKLFLEPCRRCGKYVSHGLPPTWRDFRTLEPFHDECKHC